MRAAITGALALLTFACAISKAQAQSGFADTGPLPVSQICKMIAREANTNGLPPAYFARLIWKESRFDADAVSPAGALGIAQFMPATARSEGLEDPFDPRKAIPASARFLNKLRLQLGNLGLATAAYNAGEGRVDRWLRKGGLLPIETENYVLEITGEPADAFFDPGRQIKDMPLQDGMSFLDACNRLPLIQTGTSPMALALTMPWAVQVAGNFQRSVAERNWQRIKSQNLSDLSGLPIAISRVRTPRGRRGIFAVRIGAESRSSANKICNTLRARGGSCVVMKN